MNSRKAWISLVVLAAAGALMSLAVACSSNNDNNGGNATPTEVIGGTPTGASQTPSGTMAETPGATMSGETVHIELLEFTIAGLDGAEIMSPTAGTVPFEVHNNGTVDHSLVIIKTDTDAGSLPVSGNIVDEAAAGEKAGAIEPFPTGEIKTLSVDLQPGKYALICNIVGHYQQGMHAQLIVQ